MPANESNPDLQKAEAAAFRRLLEHLRARADIHNAALLGEAGFNRNTLADWLVEASVETSRPLTREEARDIVYGEPYIAWKLRQPEPTPEQLRRAGESVAKNAECYDQERSLTLDDQLDSSFPASDPPSITRPR
ncbi:MAG: DUF1244 domain-containing protein [Sphingomonadaceae bacterium]